MAVQSETTKGQDRRAKILDLACASFLANGFHATSMQDLFRATGTTPGAFYRYFPGKDALVRALAAEAIGRLSETVRATVAEAPQSVSEALLPAIFAIDDMERANGGPRLALLIWAEAQRSTALAHVIGDAIRPMLEALDRLAEALVKRGLFGKSYEPREVAVILGGILQGYVVQRALFGVGPVAYEMGLRAVTGHHKV